MIVTTSELATLLDRRRRGEIEELEMKWEYNGMIDASWKENTLFGCPVVIADLHLDIDQDSISAIFGSGGTWNWSGASGNTSTTSGNGTNTNTASAQTLYRRNTHDEKGNARQFSTAQDELWQTNVEIAAMTNAVIWKSAEEIANDANAYRSMMARKKTVYYSKDSAALVLEILANNGMLERKNG